ncbi:hypothetical protein VHTUMSATKI_36550 [Vibrio harveyi]|nr:hypothetical protein VH1807_contig00001-0227 [Vibrio harveyi]
MDSLPDEEKYIERCFIALIAYKKPAINGGLLINQGRELDNRWLLLFLRAFEVTNDHFGHDIT